MRLFTALDLPEEIVRDLTAIVEPLRSSARYQLEQTREPARHHQVHR
jgi:2'-5' RNA ligase